MKRGQLILCLYLFTFGSVKFSWADENYCYADDDDPYIQFSTKSAYELVRGKMPPIPSYCRPVMIWASLRHGTRYPGRKTIEEMKKLMEVRDLIVRHHEKDKNGYLCAKDVDNLKNWIYMLSPSYENKLSTQGKDDLRFLAKRLKAQFSNVLDTPYSSARMSFYHDGTERTIESAEAFADGLFGFDNGNMHRNSSLLQAPETCSSWVEQVKNNSETYKEYDLFRKSNYVHSLLFDISHRLGFKENLSLEVVELMYDTCRYEKAWYIASRPPFCSVFSKDNLKVLEYMQDLKYYYEYSYGKDLNKNLACPLIADLMKHFNDVAEGNNKSAIKPVAIFYFSHSAIHIPALTLLGMKEDIGHLLHNNYEAMARREFMTSIIDPFSANLVAAFYKCTTGEENRVIFYLNEDVVRYPDCDVGLCSWKSVYEKFKPVVESSSCNFDFCNSGGSSLAFTPMMLLSVVMTLTCSFKCIHS